MALVVTPADVVIEFTNGGMEDLGHSVAGWMFAWGAERRLELFKEIQLAAGVPEGELQKLDLDNTSDSIQALVALIKNS